MMIPLVKVLLTSSLGVRVCVCIHVMELDEILIYRETLRQCVHTDKISRYGIFQSRY